MPTNLKSPALGGFKYKPQGAGLFVLEHTMTATNLNDQIEDLKKALRAELGAATTIKVLGQHPAMLTQKTLRNLKSLKVIPKNVFLHTPKGVIVITDAFLDWYFSRASRA